ncbi:glycoside hydrolase [bacterium]|nr:glycoside hydrolase [bacterium]
MNTEHSVVYRDPGRFAGWPANYGIWSWGNEIVVSFTVGYMDLEGGFHARDKSRPFVTKQARSLDGGRTWEVYDPNMRTPGGKGLSADEHVDDIHKVGSAIKQEGALGPCPGGIDFAHPDFALMCAKTGLSEGCSSFFYTSSDRCHSWQGPYTLPMYEQTGIAARTDYLIDDSNTCTLFLTANKQSGKEGRVFSARSTDAGASFDFLSFIGPAPTGFNIMPASLRLSKSDIIVAIRCCERLETFETSRHWIDLWKSTDNGLTWSHITRPAENTGSGGNPATLTNLEDGRIVLIYGYRAKPFNLCARLSEDDGTIWSDEIVIRTGGGNPDIGYPRTVLNADGEVVTCYYWNDNPDGERYISATLWTP